MKILTFSIYILPVRLREKFFQKKKKRKEKILQKLQKLDFILSRQNENVEEKIFTYVDLRLELSTGRGLGHLPRIFSRGCGDRVLPGKLFHFIFFFFTKFSFNFNYIFF